MGSETCTSTVTLTLVLLDMESVLYLVAATPVAGSSTNPPWFSGSHSHTSYSPLNHLAVCIQLLVVAQDIAVWHLHSVQVGWETARTAKVI